MSLEYLELKLRAVIVRFVVRVATRLQALFLGGPADWEVAYPRRTREYSIPSSKTPGTKITVRYEANILSSSSQSLSHLDTRLGSTY